MLPFCGVNGVQLFLAVLFDSLVQFSTGSLRLFVLGLV